MKSKMKTGCCEPLKCEEGSKIAELISLGDEVEDYTIKGNTVEEITVELQELFKASPRDINSDLRTKYK